MRIEDFLDRLENVKKSDGSWTARCPSHEDKKSSLSIASEADKILVHCFAGCHGVDVLAALRARGLLEGRSNWKPDPQEMERRKAEEDAKRQRRIELARQCWA